MIEPTASFAAGRRSALAHALLASLASLGIGGCSSGCSSAAVAPADATVPGIDVADTGATNVDAAVPSDADTAPTDALSGALLDGALEPDAASPTRAKLPRLHAFDPERAARGRAALETMPGTPVPAIALRALWLVWGAHGLDDTAYWARFCEEYGFSPGEPGEPPLGIATTDAPPTSPASASIQCLACHTNRVAAETLLGVGNAHLDLEALRRDLLALAELASTPAGSMAPLNALLEGRASAPGAYDAVGLGMALGALLTPGVELEQHYGVQQAPAWWTQAFKARSYTDGIAPSEYHGLMSATVLASGANPDEILARRGEFEDIWHYLLSLEVPEWPFEPPRAERVTEGRAVFEEHCARCHGTYADDAGTADAHYASGIYDVGTDAIRHTRMAAREIAWLNASGIDTERLEDTAGYLAPPLVGAWATAPYFHNGSVPDLRGVLRPAERPSAWRLRDADGAYDPARVGLRYDVTSDTDPKAYVARREGQSNEGHDHGAALTDSELAALLDYLKTL